MNIEQGIMNAEVFKKQTSTPACRQAGSVFVFI